MADDDKHGFKLASAYVEVGFDESPLDAGIAGLNAKIASIPDVKVKPELDQAAFDANLAMLKALAAQRVDIHVGVDDAPVAAADLGGLARVMQSLDENSARLAEAITGLDRPIRDTDESARSLGAGAQSAIERLITLAGASGSAADAAKYAYAATQLAGIGAKGLGDSSGAAAPQVTRLGQAAASSAGQARSAYGAWGMLTREVTLFGGALGDLHMVGQIPLWHILLDGILETTIGLTEATIAVGVFAAAAAPAAEDVYNHLVAVHDVVHALGVDIPPVTGHFHELQQAMAPQVVELYGGALNLMGKSGDSLAQVVSRLTTGFDNWMARLDLFSSKQSHTDGIVQAGTDVLQQMSVILDDLGVAFTNLMKADPGTVHFLLDVAEGAARLIEVVSKIPTPILYTTLAIHSFMLWGGLLTTGVVKMLSPLNSLALALGGVSKEASAVGQLGSDASGLERLKAVFSDLGAGLSGYGSKVSKAVTETEGFGKVTATADAAVGGLGSRLSAIAASPWTWAIVGAAAIADIVVETGRASEGVTSFIAKMNSGLASQAAGAAILQINTDIGQLNQKMAQVSTASIQQKWANLGNTMNSFGKDADAVGADFSRSWDQITSGHIISGLAALGRGIEGVFVPGQGAAIQAKDNIAAYRGEIVKLTGQQDNLFGETGKLIQQGYTYSQSLALMDLAGVKAGDSMALMGQKVANLITGYQDMSVRGSMLANSVDAVTFATEQQDSKIQQLTQAWTAYIGMVTGGESAFATFEEQVQGLTATASGLDTTSLSVSGGKVSVSTRAASAGLKGTTMTANSANSAVSSYARSLISASSSADRMTAAEQKLATVLQSSGMAAGSAKSAVNAYTSAVLKNGVNSGQASQARATLLADLEKAGMTAKQAASAISTLTSSVLSDSRNGELTQAARQKLITDLEHAGLTAKKAQEAVDAYSNAVDKNGINSKQAQAARTQLLKDLQGAGAAGKQAGAAIAGGAAAAKASLDGLNAASLQMKSTWQTAISDGNQLMNALLTQASAAGLGAKGTRLLTEAGKDVVAQLLPMAKQSKAATAELYALAQEAGYRGPDSFQSLTTWVGKTKNAEKDLETVTDKLTVASANLATDVQNLAQAVNQDLNQAMAAAIVQAGGGQQAFDQFATSVISSHGNLDKMSGSAANLAQILITTIGNTGQAEAEFDAFAQKLGLTHQQAETLWLSVAGGARVLTDSSPAVQKFAGQIMTAGGNSKQTANEIETLAQAVADHGTKSQQAQSARQQLIKDLENSGLSAQQAGKLVDGLTTSLGKIPHNELIKILMAGDGSYSIKSQPMTSATNPYPGGISGRKATGGQVRGGSGRPRADDIPTLLSDQEYVVQAPAVHKYGVGFFDRINAMKFADGGLVTSGNTDVLSGLYGQQLYGDFKTKMTVDLIKAMRAAMARGAGSGAAAGPGGGTAAQNEALAKSMFPFAASQWQSFVNVEMAEAGFNQFAQNPSSGAYGMPQALPYTKMPKAAWPASAGGSSNPRAQLGWMFDYIDQRYGTPDAAWAHEQAYRWYGTGGHMRPGEVGVVGDSGIELIRAGQRGATVTPAGGKEVNINVNYYGTQHPTPEMEAAMMIKLASACRA